MTSTRRKGKSGARQAVRGRGRPTKYREGLGEELTALMQEGYSLTAACAVLGFHRDSAYEWAEIYPEFSDALKIARGLRLHKLETDLLAAKDGPTVTSRIFALKNADAQEWRETIRQEHTGANGGPIRTAEESPRERVERRLAGLKVVGGTDTDTEAA